MTLVNMYFTWGSRFFPTLLMAITPWMIKEATWAYHLAAALMLIGYVAASYYCIKGFFPNQKKQLYTTSSLLFLSLFIASTWTIVQAFYWYMATVTYTVCLIMTLLALGLMIRQFHRPSVASLAALFLLSFCIIGSNEMSIFLWNLTILSIIVANLLMKKKVPTYLYILLGFCTITGLVLILAPGNFARAHVFEKAGRIGRTLGNGLLHVPLFSIKLLSAPVIVCIVAFYKEMIAFAKSFLEEMPVHWQKKFLGALWFSLFFFTTAMAFWSQGRKPVTRALNVIQFHYFLFIPFALYFLSIVVKKNWAPWERVHQFTKKNFQILFVVSFLLQPNTWLLIKDYTGTFWAWRPASEERLAILRNSRGKVITLEPLPALPGTTGFTDFRGLEIEHLQIIYGMTDIKWTVPLPYSLTP